MASIYSYYSPVHCSLFFADDSESTSMRYANDYLLEPAVPAAQPLTSERQSYGYAAEPLAPEPYYYPKFADIELANDNPPTEHVGTHETYYEARSDDKIPQSLSSEYESTDTSSYNEDSSNRQNKRQDTREAPPRAVPRAVQQRSEPRRDQDRREDRREDRTRVEGSNSRPVPRRAELSYKIDTTRIKTVMCKEWRYHGSCSWGDDCAFAHGDKEIRPRRR